MVKRHNYKNLGGDKVNNKRGRLIVRNLPFTVTEQSLTDHFSKCGDISEVLILKKPDGKLVGCGFVQFVYKQDAAKAIHNFSGKTFQGRTIIVDWAVPKDKFIQINAKQAKKADTETKNVADDKDDIVTNRDKYNSDRVDYNEDIEDDVSQRSEDDVSQGSENDVSQGSEDDVSQGSEDDVKSEIENDVENPAIVTDFVKRKPQPSHDIAEGKTVFLKNVPFSVNNEELKEFMEQFGSVHYAVVCIDPLTEHSKGTAFVKFKSMESAKQCLSSEKLNFHDAVMEVFEALSRNSINDREEQKHSDKKKDNRNLYLVKEGVIMAGSKAAEGVSDADMKKRLELEMWKSNMLRNLNMFVSRTRLIIHNLPVAYDDANLRALFKKYSPPTSRIIEAKVMKNLRNVDNEGKATSKGYGFVSFANYEDALAALRAINNRPDIFNKNKRPIVSFSIENRVMVNAKQRRMEKSRLNNPLCPDYKKPKLKRNRIEQSQISFNRNNNNNNNNDIRKHISDKRARTNVKDDYRTFEGNKAKEGDVKLRSKRKITAQNELHSQNVKERKYKIKTKKRLLEKRNEKKREAKMKSKAKKLTRDDKEFNNLVDRYKKRIMPHVGNLKKWYET